VVSGRKPTTWRLGTVIAESKATTARQATGMASGTSDGVSRTMPMQRPSFKNSEGPARGITPGAGRGKRVGNNQPLPVAVLDDGYLGGLVVAFQDTAGVDGVFFNIPESSGYSIDENFKAVLHFYRLCDSLTGQHLMCNLYSITRSQTAIIEFTRAMKDSTGNLPPMPGIFPDYKAPVVANKGGIRELCMMRWGMPSSQLAQMESAKKRAAKLEAKGKSYDFKELLRMEPDSGTTNIRNVGSKHWKRWLGVENRCVVPFTSFSEFNKAEGATSGSRLMMVGRSRCLPASGRTGHRFEK
jgi:hypothetical protein